MTDSAQLFDRISVYRAALDRLREALAQPETAFMRDAIIQRFEFTFELAWKVLRLALRFHQIEVQSPKEALREAFSFGLISSGDGWTRLQKERNLTSHTYDEQAAIELVAFLRAEGLSLFTALEQKLDALQARGVL